MTIASATPNSRANTTAASTATRDVAVSVERLPFGGRARLLHWRIDAHHSNSYAAWRSIGAPQDPSDEQLSAMKERQSLQLLEPERDVAMVNGQLTASVALPLPSVSLLQIRPAGA